MKINRISRLLFLLCVLFILIPGIFILYAASSAHPQPFYGIRENNMGAKLKKEFSQKNLRFVTYNIGYASGNKNNKGHILSREEVTENLSAIAKTLKELDADIIGLQEVDFNASRTFGINQLEFLANALNMPHSAHAITWNKKYVPWPYWPPKIHFGRVVSGQAVLSRYPINKHDVITFAKPSSNPFWRNWFYLDRIAEHLIIQIENTPVSIWHVHLEAFDSGARLQQTDELIRKILEDNHQWIWAFGDFNSISNTSKGLSQKQIENLPEKHMALENFIKQTHFKNAEKPDSLSFPSWNPEIKIDHILFKEQIKLLKVGNVEKITASDHLPVWAEFDFLK